MVALKKASLLLNRYSSVQVPLPVPVIKVPKYVEKHIEKVKLKEFSKELNLQKQRKIVYRGDTSTPVISSTHGDFNFYLGQRYNERYKLPLQSEFWFKTKSSGQKFTIHPYETHPALPSKDPQEFVDETYLPNEFYQMNLNPNIVNSLRNDFKYENPTRIQTLAIPKILSGENVLMATETGSGKTISYLAPFLHQISMLKKTTTRGPDSPLGVVITPGRELAEQIGIEAFKLAQSCNVNVKVLISDGTNLKNLRLQSNSEIDLIIASSGCLIKLFQKLKIKMGCVRHLALDEADTLLDDSFITDTQYLFQRLSIQSQNTMGAQLVLSSSIYPSNVHEIFCDEFTEENITKICSPYLHRVPTHIEQRFIRVSNDSRSGDLLELVKKDYEKKKQVLIFCNKSQTCDWLSKFLEGNGIYSEVFHGAVEPRKRSGIIRQFKRGMFNVLCCTDLASRGIDTKTATHVINFDFPNNVSDYLLRAGRVGRVGSSKGYVTNLVVSTPGVHTVMEIERSVKMCERLPNCDSNIKKKINKLYFSY